ncbi:MAG: transcriptional repressor LexA [Acidobacteriota bacterium]|jgi:repressor LexA|nr:transcriptional repressor LexA [Acidobacteriota bacterium]
MKLTQRQKEILDFITEFIDGNGYSPSMEEIAGHFKFASLNAVYKHLEALSSRGYLRRDANRARSIELSAGATAGVQNLPLFGYVAAGHPIEAISNSETMPIPEFFLSRRNDCYVLKVKGDSMIEDHIQDGDYVVVESRTAAVPGETVVALIDNENVTLKKYYPENGRIRLQPANATLAPIVVEPQRVKLQGVVVSVMRKY